MRTVLKLCHLFNKQTPSHERAAALGRGGPAQPAQLVLLVGGVAQAVESLQCPAAQHDGPPVAERLEAPAAVVAAEAARPWWGGAVTFKFRKNCAHDGRGPKPAFIL